MDINQKYIPGALFPLPFAAAVALLALWLISASSMPFLWQSSILCSSSSICIWQQITTVNTIIIPIISIKN